MASAQFQKPGRALTVWSLVLALAFAALVATDLGMLRHAHALRAQDYQSHLEDAGRMLEVRDFPGALAKIERAKELAPKKPEPFVMMGHLHYKLQQWGQAIKAYHDALDLGSEDPGVRQNLVWSYIEIQQFETAAKLGEQSIADGIETPALARYTAEAWFRAGKFKESIPHLEVALRKWSNDLYLLDHLRRALRETGDTARAKRISSRMAEVRAALGRNSS